jgi:hypothetical protein
MPARIEATDKHGIKWVVTGNTQAELETGVAALSTSITKQNESAPPRRGRPPKGDMTKQNQKQLKRIQIALTILREIDTRNGAANASSIGKAAGLTGRALGPAMGLLGRVIKEASLPQEKVYHKSGIGNDAIWVSGSEMSIAIKKLEDMEKGMK